MMLRSRTADVLTAAVIAVGISALVTSSSSASSPPRRCGQMAGVPTPAWADVLDRLATADNVSHHPLVGRVHFSAPRANPEDCRARDIFTNAAAVLIERGVLIIGEVHDNARHHRFRAELIVQYRNSSATGPVRPSEIPIVFEHLRADQAEALGKLQTKDSTPVAKTADEWLAALDWEKSGWPDKAMFKPLFDEVIAGRHPVYPAEPARGIVRDIARQGLQAVGGEEIKRLKLDKPLAEPLQNALLDELEASHCGLMPRSAFGKMAEAQRFRDAHYAAVIEAAAETHQSGVVLLAGNGHVRRDRGVPYYLALRGKQAYAVGLVEVEDGKTSPDDYVERGPDGRPIYDAILFTARAARKDPCEDMRAMMQKK